MNNKKFSFVYRRLSFLPLFPFFFLFFRLFVFISSSFLPLLYINTFIYIYSFLNFILRYVSFLLPYLSSRHTTHFVFTIIIPFSVLPISSFTVKHFSNFVGCVASTTPCHMPAYCLLKPLLVLD